MNRILVAAIASGLLVLSLSFSCSPKVTPTLQPALPKATIASPQPVSTKTAEELAWDQIVEKAKKEGKVTVYSFTWVGDIGTAIAQAFKDKYGIKVEIVTGRGAEFLERLKTEKRLSQVAADIWEGSTLQTNAAKDAGVLTSVANDLPAFREKGVWLTEPTAIDPTEKTNLAWRLITYGPFINTRSVKPEDVPHTWKDLLDPKWKGKMTLTDPSISGVVYTNAVTLMDNKVWDENYLRSLYQQKLGFPNGPQEEARILATGKYQVSVVLADVSAARFAMEGAPIQAIDMKDGIVVTTGSIAAIANGPQPNAAKLLLNWLYSSEGITVAGKAMGNKMVRKDVPDFRPGGVQMEISKPFVEKVTSIDKATQLFREKWFNTVVGR